MESKKQSLEMRINQEEVSAQVESLFQGNLEKNLMSSGKFSSFCPTYSFATENLTGYMSQIDLQNKRVLTVSASGDQIIEAYAMGATEVESFDINILSAFVTDLKLTAVKTLSFEEYQKFLLRQDQNNPNQLNSQALNKKTYLKLRSQLNDSTQTFFDNLYQLFQDGSQIRESPIFNNQYDTNQLKTFSNKYLQSKHYYEQAQLNLRKGQIPSWTCSSVTELTKNFTDEKFDVILLSNIADYAEAMFPNNSNYIQKFIKQVIQPLVPKLNPRGIICAAYVYDIKTKQTQDTNQTYRSQIDNPSIRRQELQSTRLDYQELVFPSVLPLVQDGVIILTNSELMYQGELRC